MYALIIIKRQFSELRLSSVTKFEVTKFSHLNVKEEKIAWLILPQ